MPHRLMRPPIIKGVINRLIPVTGIDSKILSGKTRYIAYPARAPIASIMTIMRQPTLAVATASVAPSMASPAASTADSAASKIAEMKSPSRQKKPQITHSSKISPKSVKMTSKKISMMASIPIYDTSWVL